MSIDKTTEELYQTFEQDLAKKGYVFEHVEPENSHYQEGLRLRYILPEDIAMKPHQHKTPPTDESIPITQVALIMSKGFFKHAGDFYNTARDSAKNIGQQLKTTEPMFSKDGRQIIYLGFQ